MDITVSLVADAVLGIVGEATVTPKGNVVSVKFYANQDFLRRNMRKFYYKYDALPEPHVFMTPRMDMGDCR